MANRVAVLTLALLAVLLAPHQVQAAYTNYESSHVHPIDLTPNEEYLLVVNTPDARLEVFAVAADGSLQLLSSVPVGLEPITVRARNGTEAWVVNNLSDSVSVVDLDTFTTIDTIDVGDEPTDVAFASGKAFVAVSEEDAVKVFDPLNRDLPPLTVDLFSRDVRALSVSLDASKVYAVALKSGNQTTVIDTGAIFSGGLGFDAQRLAGLGLNPIECDGAHPPYPPLPTGITRNPDLIDPPSGVPPVSLIVQWNAGAGQWQDDAGQDWTNCLPFRLPDHDLFIIDAANPTAMPPVTVDHIGTSLFEVSVRPGNDPGAGRIYVPHTEARNHIRFEHPLGVQGHMVDNRMAVIDPGTQPTNQVTQIDLNTHINRNSDPATNLAERQASVSQPGMMTWRNDGTEAFLTAIGSRKVFRVDGACLAGNCIFGANRAAPAAVVVGEGPTGVALDHGSNVLYVLLRFSNSLALVDAATLTKLGEVPLHDPSPPDLLTGRRFLYDGIDSSGHGDAACSSCHLSGDTDGMTWDLGNPEGEMVPYDTPNDNVRFITLGGVDCIGAPGLCTSHEGFDPQKGPMATQTLRSMLEPLHWRGDRPTMRDFNAAFVGLMGRQDIGTPGNPKGLSDADMDAFRTFALGIRMPPNPFRNVDDTLPNSMVQPHGSPFPGNPFNGENLFNNHLSDGGATTCVSCHAHPFGASGGKLGGVQPTEPTSMDTTALFNGVPDGSPHSDLEVPHLRNMHEKYGPTFGPAGGPYPDAKTGYGFVHDGSIPDLGTFLSASVFSLTAAEAADIATFMFYFPTDSKPAVGRQVTVAAGMPPTGTTAEEALLTTLIGLGDLDDNGRHCELVASAPSGDRTRTWYLSAGEWTTDVDGQGQVSTTALRMAADGSITFMCVPLDSGIRLGADRDEDLHFNGSDCAAADPAAWQFPGPVTQLGVAANSSATLTWDAQTPLDTVPFTYEVAGGNLSDLSSTGLDGAGCLVDGLANPTWDDTRSNPPLGDGHYYIVQARKPCAAGGYGAGRDVLDSLSCVAP